MYIIKLCLTQCSLCLIGACSDTISHKIAGDTDTQNVPRSRRGHIKMAVDVPQPYWVRHNNRNARHSHSIQRFKNGLTLLQSTVLSWQLRIKLLVIIGLRLTSTTINKKELLNGLSAEYIMQIATPWTMQGCNCFFAKV